MLSADKITREEFDEVLGRYQALVKGISTSKPAKDNQDSLSLEQLDKLRFEDMPNRYYKRADLEDPATTPRPLERADVIQLVKWKLKHGTFRPNLMKLAESNMEDEIKTATQAAFETYKQDKFEVTNAINKLTTLKGIGPATASLLLSVHDAAWVVFFGDEVFQWICSDGKKATIKYNMKEYGDLISKSRNLIKRLGVDARDVEKVGFVLMKEAGGSTAKENGIAAREIKVNDKEPKAVVEDGKEADSEDKPAKRRKRGPKPVEKKEPTDMTPERKAQLVAVAAKGRAARIARKEARVAKGKKFRERVDAAKEKNKDDPNPSTPNVKVGTQRKSDVTTRGSAASAKRARRSEV